MEYKFKIKALILFEKITDKAFKIETTEDLYIYFYCVKMVNDEKYNQNFEEFLNDCDEHPELMQDFIVQFTEYNKRQQAVNNWRIEGFDEKKSDENTATADISVTDLVKNCNNIHVLIEEQDYYLIDLYSKQYMEDYKRSWEQTRFVAYITAQCQSTKKLKIEDIMKFPWQASESKKKKTHAISADEKNRIAAEMQKLQAGIKTTNISITENIPIQ